MYTEYDESSYKLYARRVVNNELIHANKAFKKDGPFYCPETFEKLIIRRCREKINHFAYKARFSPILSKEETELHKNCKEEIRDALKEVIPFGNWEVERTNLSEDRSKGYNKVIPDISGRLQKNGKAVIIEIQASTLGIDKIIKRTIEYSKRGAYILWIVPLKEGLGHENFRPRIFERFLHQMYYGKTYYWIKGNGRFLIPVHYDTAFRKIEVSHWFEPGGIERNEGGYDKAYRRVKSPLYGELVDIADDFLPHDRDPFIPENEKMKVPACKILKDNLKNWWT